MNLSEVMKITVACAALSGVTACVAEPPPAEHDIEQPSADEEGIDILIVDSVTQAPLEKVLVCTQNYPTNCDTTDAWGVARLQRSDEDVELTYLAAYYRVHRHPVRADAWMAESAIVLPAISNDVMNDALNDEGIVADDYTGFVMLPRMEGLSTQLDPASGDGPIDRLARWTLFANVDKGDLDVLLDAPCSAPLAPESEGAPRLSIESGIVTVISELSCR